MKRTRRGEMVPQSDAASSASSSGVAARSVSAGTIDGLVGLLSAAVASAQTAADLPPHEWTTFTIASMTSQWAATHSTPSVLRNAHAFNQLHHPEQAGTSNAKKKRRVKNADGKWDTVRVEGKQNQQQTSDSATTDASVATAAAATSSAAASAPAGMVDVPATVATPALAVPYNWACVIADHLQRLLASDDASAVALRTRADISVEVPAPNSAVRGDGFINFTINERTLIDGVPSSSLIVPAPVPSALDADTSTASFSFASIGTISSVYKLKYGTPRQGTIAPSSRGTLTLHPSIAVDSLDGLDEYSHIWLVFIFHRNENKKFRPKIEPPRAGGRKLGVFSTRTPHRVNPIGLSLVKLEKIEGRKIHLSSLDLIQGTPIIDIKPYHPADCMPEHTIPEWMSHQNEVKPPFEVYFSSEADAQLREIIDADRLEFYQQFDEAREAIRESVSHDPRPIYVRSRASCSEVYGYRLDRMNVLYRVDDAAQRADVCAVQYVDYEKLLADQEAEGDAAGGTGASVAARAKKHGSKHVDADEEYITKKFLESRPRQEYPMQPTQPTPDEQSATNAQANGSENDTAVAEANQATVVEIK